MPQVVMTRGFVNFPIDDGSFTSTREGGTYVSLVVVDPNDLHMTKAWMLCCGGYQYIFHTEELACTCKTHMDGTVNCQAHWFPNIGANMRSTERYISREFLFAATIGSTSWTGYNTSTKEVWVCTYDHLTDDGKLLVAMVEKLYPICTWHLLTWVDT